MKIQLIVFKIADQVYAFKNKDVCDVRLVSGSSLLFSGITHWDKAIPVIDLRQRFGFPLKKKPSSLERIIILELEGELVGIKVDEVLGVSCLEVKWMEADNGSMESGVISGVGQWDQEPLLLLDCNRLFLEEIRYNSGRPPGSKEDLGTTESQTY